DLETVQTAEELAAHVGAYLASRLERRPGAVDRVAADPDRTEADTRILEAYNRIVLPGDTEAAATARPFLEPARRLWATEETPRLDPAVVEAAFPQRIVPTSAGHLETFAKCPYRHFARSLLRLEPRPRGEVTPLENGRLAHRALEILHRRGAPPKDRAAIDALLRRIIEEIETEEEFRAYAFDPSGAFRLRSARRQLLHHLEIEAQRLEAAAFRPELFEQEFGTAKVPPLQIPLIGGGVALVRGRIDRIDLLRSGGAVEALVLDYKSNDLKNRSDLGNPVAVEQGFDLQIAVYLLVAEEVLGYRPYGGFYVPVLPRPVSSLGSNRRNPLDIRMRGIVPRDRKEEALGSLPLLRGVRGALPPDRDAVERLLVTLRGRIGRLAEEILAGRIDVSPAGGKSRFPCDHCEFAAVCRFDRRRDPIRRTPFEGLVGGRDDEFSGKKEATDPDSIH
ncbi:MAG: hypothetical protein GF346_11880, partial [Candidatus Eisenbacteria bacterium]|nr:hypothetical protein [Candidatus Latescibacterota bacterium]MBD3303135.1 hypothetical protein [Candidatus Eisenbacteria bacterium]